MMTTLGPQLRKQRRRMGLSLDDLSKLTGISKPYLSLVENSKTKGVPSDAKLTVLEQTLKFPTGTLLAQAHLAKTPLDVRNILKDLLTKQSSSQSVAPASEGAGPAAREGAAPGGALTLGKSLDDAYLSGALQSLVEDRAGNLQPARFRQVPLINKVAAGYPTDFTDLDYPTRVADNYIPAPESAVSDPTEAGGGGFAARVSGQSMLPTYRDGDIIVFSTTPDPKDGDDCFIRLEDGRTTFKRVFFQTSPNGTATVRLEPLNPKFSPKLLPAQKIAGIYKATWISRAL